MGCHLSPKDESQPFLEADWRSFRAKLVANEKLIRPIEPSSFSSSSSSSTADLDKVEDHQPSLITVGDKWAHTIHEPEKGCLLIATSQLDGVHIFERTVVLLLSTGPVGPYGIILNRPSLMSIKEMRSPAMGLEGTFSDRPLFFGGPLEEGLFLVSPKGAYDNDRVARSGVFVEVMKGLYYGTKESVGCAAEMVKRNVVGVGDFRFFDGYCGWEAEQLKEEIIAGYWTVAACSASVLGLHTASNLGLHGATNRGLQSDLELWEEVNGLVVPKRESYTFGLHIINKHVLLADTQNPDCKKGWHTFPQTQTTLIKTPLNPGQPPAKSFLAGMESPLYDVVILGASGFTGKYVVREALKFLNTTANPSFPLKTLALAGRNPSKLAQSLKWAAHPDPPPPIPILSADTSDPSSLRLLCSKTKLLLNCVGPFRLHGDPVVAACADTGCDYLDICGEPEFMERMEVQYHGKAAETGSLVVSACGFDSIPAEMGWMFNSRQWVGPSVPNQIEAYVSLESDKRIVGNFGTYESAVLGVANMHKLQELRRSRPKRARPVIPGPYPPKGPVIDHQKEIGLWAVKLPSADSVVVRRTLVHLTENPHGLPGVNESSEQVEKRAAFWSMMKPAHFGVKLGSKTFFGILRTITLGMFIGLLGRNAIGRWLLLKFPSFFSLGWFRKNGPTEDEVKSASFKMWFIGRGFSDINQVSQGNAKPDMEIVTRLMGPEVGYVTTPIVLLQCALILLSQRDNLPRGGVFPPGIVFGATDLQERLQQNGISFDVISKRTVQT
ncbi:hypothetical protein Tsubulata_004053 [Turnera subulata]|uniref:Saccharopine dehydrogenase NADP binding domain-containing protein n=1 Tax=Turnera subulata TaxID=218843 RepID=A0A9Q0F7T6_9ROSI|nr:hypothetical protein Tsubulata_004053 [Turnera subulata]